MVILNKAGVSLAGSSTVRRPVHRCLSPKLVVTVVFFILLWHITSEEERGLPTNNLQVSCSLSNFENMPCSHAGFDRVVISVLSTCNSM